MESRQRSVTSRGNRGLRVIVFGCILGAGIMLIFDRLLSVLLVLGAIGHTLGVLKFYRGQPHPLFWALCATLLILLLAAVNLLRADRPGDHGLAWVAAGASAAYVGVSIAFGVLVGNPWDVRALSFAAVALCLTALSVRGALLG